MGLKNKSAMTLVEILVATMVLSIVVLSAGTIYVSSMRELTRCIDGARVQREMSFALDHVFLNLISAKGIVTAAFPSGSITVFTDDPAYTPQMRYELDGARLKFTYKIGAAGEASEYITDEKVDIDTLTFDRILLSDRDTAGVFINNYVSVDIEASSGLMQGAYSTGVTLRGMSGA